MAGVRRKGRGESSFAAHGGAWGWEGGGFQGQVLAGQGWALRSGEKAVPVAKGDPAGTEDEGEDGSAHQDGLKHAVAGAGVAHAVSQTEEEGDTTTKDEREAAEPRADPALLWGRCRNRFTAGLWVFWFHLHGAVRRSA